MSYKVIVAQSFEKQAKPLLKKYASLKKEIGELIASLKDDPKQGVSLGLNCFKIRLSIASKGKGKSGGARIITHIYFTEDMVFLVGIYDKSQQSSISDEALKELIKSLY